jgi:hypothetical protein
MRRWSVVVGICCFVAIAARSVGSAQSRPAREPQAPEAHWTEFSGVWRGTADGKRIGVAITPFGGGELEWAQGELVKRGQIRLRWDFGGKLQFGSFGWYPHPSGQGAVYWAYEFLVDRTGGQLRGSVRDHARGRSFDVLLERTEEPVPAGAEKPFYVPAFRGLGGFHAADNENVVAHVSSSCPLIKGRKTYKYGRSLGPEHWPNRSFCVTCSPGVVGPKPMDIYLLETGKDPQHAAAVHRYYLDHPRELLEQIRDNPDYAAWNLAHYDQACPLLRGRSLRNVSLKSFATDGRLNVCPLCRLREPDQSPSRYVTVDLVKESDDGTAAAARRQAVGDLILALGDLATVVAGGQPSGARVPTSAGTGDLTRCTLTASTFFPSRAGLNGSAQADGRQDRKLDVIVPAQGGSVPVNVSTLSSCIWWSYGFAIHIRRPENWVTMVPGYISGSEVNRTGPGSISFTVQPYTARDTFEQTGYRTATAYFSVGQYTGVGRHMIGQTLEIRLKQCAPGISADECFAKPGSPSARTP